MNKQPASCSIICDHDGIIHHYVCNGLKFDDSWVGNNLTLGFIYKNQLIGGLIYHDLRPECDVWWTIYTTSPKWCTKSILKSIFGLAFKILKVRRISLLVSVDNLSCISLVERLGFKREGCLRQYRDDKKDCYIYGMLKSENKWKEKNE